jgi:Family of unknown function (DUF6256)
MSSHLIRSDLVPILSGYVILMVILAVGLRVQRRRARAGLPDTRITGRFDRGWLAVIVHVVADAVSGYLLLGAIVVLYYYGVARVGGNFLDSAFTGSALMLGISVPLFAGASLLVERRRRRAEKGGSPAPPAASEHGHGRGQARP